MRVIGILGILLVLLTGCSLPVWETVDDPSFSEPVSAWQENTYEILLGIPEGTSLLAEHDGSALYTTEHGELEIETRTFLAPDLAHAVKQLSGFAQDQLIILKTQRFGLPEYQFAWVSQSDQGMRLYRADLVMDETCCYAVVCSSLEEAGDYAAFQARQVFGTFGLGQNGV